MLGDRPAALDTAASIHSSWFQGRATCRVAMQCGTRGEPDEVVHEITTAITNPWWRAAALAAVDAGQRSATREDDEPSSSQAQTALASIPKGDARTRLHELIASAALRAGRLDLALGHMAGMSTGRDIRLMTLGRLLAATGDAEALMRFISLAKLLPEQAAAVAAEVTTDGSNAASETTRGSTGSTRCR